MVGGEGGAHLGEALAQAGGLLHGDGGTPGHEVPADLLDAAGGEA